MVLLKSCVTIIRSREVFEFLLWMDWVPHCKKTFNGAGAVIKYLGKYMHRIAVSNHRIVRMDDDTVTFRKGLPQ